MTEFHIDYGFMSVQKRFAMAASIYDQPHVKKMEQNFCEWLISILSIKIMLYGTLLIVTNTLCIDGLSKNEWKWHLISPFL